MSVNGAAEKLGRTQGRAGCLRQLRIRVGQMRQRRWSVRLKTKPSVSATVAQPCGLVGSEGDAAITDGGRIRGQVSSPEKREPIADRGVRGRRPVRTSYVGVGQPGVPGRFIERV